MRYIGGHHTPEAVDGFNEWVAFFAAACTRAVSHAETYETEVTQLRQTWRARLRKVRSGSATDLLLDVLPGAPIVTIQSAAALIDRSVQAVNEAVPRLTDAGIPSQTTVGKRNRAFEARELIDALTALERQLASPVRRSPCRRDGCSADRGMEVRPRSRATTQWNPNRTAIRFRIGPRYSETASDRFRTVRIA